MDYCRIIKNTFAVILVGLMLTSCGLLEKPKKQHNNKLTHMMLYMQEQWK